jgi:hypothetical protein
VKTNANKVFEIPTIPSDLNEEWETVKSNANKVPGIEYDIDNIKSTLQTQSGSGSRSGSGSDLLIQQIGDIKRYISNTVIAGIGITIEKILRTSSVPSKEGYELYSLIYAKGM